MRKADSVHSDLAQKILDEADPLFLEAIEQETVLAMLHNDDDKELRFYKLDEATRFCQVGHYVMKSKRLGKGLYWWVVEDFDGKLITCSRSVPFAT